FNFFVKSSGALRISLATTNPRKGRRVEDALTTQAGSAGARSSRKAPRASSQTPSRPAKIRKQQTSPNGTVIVV
ncbi:hypothetical protein EXIGLDRAFT_728048, partial [Exidia glandulosa HHB12029]